MAKKRQRQKRPKPEPVAKPIRRTRDALQVLYERGTLGADELRAALEIRRVWLEITGASFAKAQRYEIGLGGSGPQDWPKGLEYGYLNHYKPWAAEMGKRQSADGIPWMGLVFDAVVDEHTLTQIDHDHQWREGKAAGYIRQALGRYVTIARWRIAA